MKFSNLKKQRGAVLAFSLMMLLLLTLAGVSMIQQNKMQLEMSNNARLLTQEFATTEGYLQAAKDLINKDISHDNYNASNDVYFPTGTKLAINHPSHQCTPTSAGIQNLRLAGPVAVPTLSGASVTVTSVKCKSSDSSWDGQICSTYDKATEVVTCNPTNHATACTNVAEAIATFDDSTTDACYQPYDPQGNYGTLITTQKCPKEIYTIEVTSTTGSATSTIVSDHVVGCGS